MLSALSAVKIFAGALGESRHHFATRVEAAPASPSGPTDRDTEVLHPSELGLRTVLVRRARRSTPYQHFIRVVCIHNSVMHPPTTPSRSAD